jgi:hypothetical protein
VIVLAACAVMLCALATVAEAGGAAKRKTVHLRVVTSTGRTLAEERETTGTTEIKARGRADCFGEGTGGSGDRVRVRGATALGVLADVAEKVDALRPLLVTDSFLDDGFGLGVCGVGGFKAAGDAYWYLKRDHVGASISGSQLKLHRGDDVLWYLTPSYPPPVELALEAPASASNGTVTVRVFEYDDLGARASAAGARVHGGDGTVTTDGQGRATVPLGPGAAELWATRTSDGAIPSNHERVKAG